MAGPDGYQVGNAWVQVLPSFNSFQRKMAAYFAKVGDVTIPAQLDVNTKNAEAAAKATESKFTARPVKIRTELDDRKLNAQLEKILAGRDEKLIKIDIDISAAKAKIAELNRQRGSMTIDVDAEITKAEAKIHYLEAQRHRVVIEADVDTDKAQRALDGVDEHLKRIGNNQTDINMEASDASRAVAVLGLVVAALGAVAYAAPAAAAAVATVPAAVLAAGQAFATISAGFNGVGGAVKALQAVEDEGATTASAAAQKRVAAANRIANAQSSLEAALANADQSAISSAHQVQDAREGLAAAQVDAGRRVEDAERSLQTAQLAERDAQVSLTQARKDAKARLDDLRISVAGAALDEEGAVLAVQRARERLTKARAAGTKGLDLQEIALSARQAEQSLVEVRKRYTDLKTEATQANKAGINGNTQVIAAQRQVGDAATRVQDAERGLSQSRVDGAARVAKAQESLSRAQQQASFAAASASRQVADAQRAIAQASVTAGAQGTAAANKLAIAMGKLTPEGRAFAHFLQDEAKPALAELGAAAQTTMLPKIQGAFNQLLTLAPLADAALADTGNVIGDLAIKGADMVTSGPWREDFARIVGRNNRLLALMGDSGLHLLDSFRNLTVASGPLVESILTSTEAWTDQFAVWLQGKRDSGELETWFNRMGVRVRELWQVVTQLVGGVINLARALAPVGRFILHIIGPLAEFIGDLAKANPVLSSVLGLTILLGAGFISLFRTLGGLSQAFRTSRGVFDSMVLGQRGAKKATDETTAALGNNRKETGRWREAVAGSTGLVGKASTGLRSLRDAYTQGSTSARGWATSVGTNAATAVARFNTAVFGSSVKLEEQNRAFGKFSGGIVTGMGRAASAAGGTARALARGVGGAVTGLVGALGGPFGIAITGAVVGLGFLAEKQAEAAQKTADHEAKVKTLTDALVESHGKINSSIKDIATSQLQSDGIADNVGHLGLKLGDMANALTLGGDSARKFETDLQGVENKMISQAQNAPGLEHQLHNISKQLAFSGGEARDYSEQIDDIVDRYQLWTGASDAQTDAYRNELVEYLDLVGGYADNRDTWDQSRAAQQDQAKAHNDAATAIERQFRALQDLQGETLQSVNKEIAYKSAQNATLQAHQRTVAVLKDVTSTTEDVTAARLAEENTMLQQIQASADLAAWNNRNKTEGEIQKAVYVATAQEAANLANVYGVNLPDGIKKYLAELGVAKNAHGVWVVQLKSTPKNVDTTARFHDKAARDAVKSYGKFLGEWITNLLDTNVGPTTGSSPTPSTLGSLLGLPAPKPKKKARGGIVTPFARGGMQPMSADMAEIVPPNTWRIIGDRMVGDEAFIPLVKSARSDAILAEAASRLGFSLVPTGTDAAPMADGGVTGTPTSPGASAALVVDPAPVDAFTTSVQGLVASGLAPLAAEVTDTTTPAFTTLETHAGTLAPAAVNQLLALLPVLQDASNKTAEIIALAWQRIVVTASVGVTHVGAYLAGLRSGLTATTNAVTAMANNAAVQFGRIQPAAANPIRAVLQGPINAGLVAAWNSLDSQFSFKRHINPVAIGFAGGGRVRGPGTGTSDSIPAALSNNEFVVQAKITKRTLPFLEALNSGQAEALQAAGYAKGGLVANTGGQLNATMARGLAWAARQTNKPYIWGAVGPDGYDCSGLQSALTNVLRDEASPYRRLGTASSVPWPGFVRGLGSAYGVGASKVHTAGTLAGVNIEATGNHVRLGGDAQGADSAQFPVQASLPVVGGKFTPGGGSFDPKLIMSSAFSDTLARAADIGRRYMGNVAAEAGVGMTNTAVRGASATGTKLLNSLLATSQTAGSPQVVAAVRAVANQFGWGTGPEWNALSSLITGESGWNPSAANPTSSARGLFQKLTSVHGPLEPTVAGQAQWGLSYIRDTYGTPSNAFRQWSARSPHWYDEGGILPPGYSTVYNGTGRSEYVLNGPQWKSLISMADNNSGGGFTGNLYLSSGEWLGHVDGRIDQANNKAGRSLASRIR